MDKENKLREMKTIYEENENKYNASFNTPVRFEKRRGNNLKHDQERNRQLNHSTPSPKSRSFINPFEAGLRKCLHLSVLSPSVFTNIISPSQDPTLWRIEDVSLINPAPIEENPIEQFEHFESEDDAAIQETIKSYFLSSQIVPSPCEPLPKTETENLLHLPKIDENKSEDSEFNNSLKETKNSSSQTELTLPPILPPEVEKILKPYFTYNQDQQDSEDVSLNNSSLRRKLLFGEFDECENMSISYSDQESTPLKSGRMITPHRFSSFQCFRGLESSPKEGFKKRTYGTPLPGEAVQSPSTSPIVYTVERNQSQMSITSATCNSSFVRTLNFNREINTNEENQLHEDMSIVISEEALQEPVNSTPYAISNPEPNITDEGGHSHNMAGFLSTQMQSQDTGYSSSVSSIQQGHIESADSTWKLSSNIFSSTPSK